MEAMNCQACRIEIEETETSQSLSVEARAHAETCLPCRAVRDEHRALRRLVGSLEAVSAPPDFDFRLRARLAGVGGEDHRRFTWRRFAPYASLVGITASLVLAVAAAVVYKQVWLGGPQATRQAGVVNKPPVNVETARTAATSNSNRSEETSATVNAPTAPYRSSEDSLGTGDEGSRRNSPRLLRSRIFSAAARRYAGASDSGNQVVNSYDSAVTPPPPLITPTAVNNPAVDPVPSIVLPVRSSAPPMLFFLKGWDGVSHSVSLKSVTFGSERLVDQNEGTGAFNSDASDIW